MAWTFRGWESDNTATTTGTTLVTPLSAGGTNGQAWTAAPQPGDLLVAVGMVAAAAATWTRTGGSAWTLLSSGNSNSGGFTSFCAWRWYQPGDTGPTFTSSATNYRNESVYAFTPSKGVPDLDVAAAVLVATTAATSFTPGAATAAEPGELSVIISAGLESAVGANAVTLAAAPANWTVAGTSGYAGTSSFKSRGVGACYRLAAAAGSNAPAAETFRAGTATTVQANVYHLLFRERFTGWGVPL